MRRTLVVALLTIGAFLASAAAVSAQSDVDQRGVGIRLMEVPSDRSSDPRAQQYIVDHVDHGETIVRRVQVVNHEPVASTVRVYAEGATIADTSFQPSEQPDDQAVARWTELDRSSVDLPAKGSATVEATITVPADAPDGEHYGVIWAELPGATSAGGVTVVNRVGVRIYLSVGEGGEPDSDFEVDTLTAARTADGVPVVAAKVHNTGGRALDMNGELELTEGPSGLSAGPFPAEVGTTLGIGETGDVLVPLGREIPDGPWTATLTLRSGELEGTVQATITFPDGAGEVGEAVEAERVTDSLSGLAFAGLALLSALLVLGGLLLYLRSRRAGR